MTRDRLPADWPRSYRRRQGQPTRAQRRAMREHWDTYGLDCPYDRVLDPDAIFGAGAEGAPVMLEIGFGMGEHLIAYAEAHPQHRVLAVEVHVPALGAALKAIDARGFERVRVIRHDAFELLGRHLPDRALDEVVIFFPEPWPSDPTGRRRLVRPLLLELLAHRMRPGGLVRLATDVDDYAAHIQRTFEADPRWRGGPSARDAIRPITRYEQKGIDAGRTIHDLRYRLTSPQGGACTSRDSQG